jgi:hypothetical protein
MSAPFGGAFPGMPAAGVPGAQPQQQVAGFVLVIPPDPNWQPIDNTDVLEKDGYYVARIKTEKPVAGGDDKPGVWLTLELGDPDVIGKQLSKKMVDPHSTKNDSWWTWRTLMRSVTGTVEGGQAGMTYSPGVLQGKIVYIRTGLYIDNNGTSRTGVDAFITRPEWEEAVKSSKHRWDAKPKVQSGGGAGPAGALPGSGGGAFPGLGTGGLPGLPASPANPMAQASAPQPAAAAPMAQAPTGAFGGFTQPAAAQTTPQPGTNGAFPAFPGT